MSKIIDCCDSLSTKIANLKQFIRADADAAINPKASQLAVRNSLLGQVSAYIAQYTPRPRIISSTPNANGNVTGKFESTGRVFTFNLTNEGLAYKPLVQRQDNESDDDYSLRFDASSGLYLENFVPNYRSDAAKAFKPKPSISIPTTKKQRGTRKDPNCGATSYQCGVCISIGKNCIKNANTAALKDRLTKINALSKMAANGGVVPQVKTGAIGAKVDPKSLKKKAQDQAREVAKGGKTSTNPNSKSETVKSEPKTIATAISAKAVAKAEGERKAAGETANKAKTSDNKKSKAEVSKPKKEAPKTTKDTNQLTETQLIKKIQNQEPISSNEVPDTERLGSSRLLKYGKPAKNQEQAQDLILDASTRLSQEFALEGLVPVDRIKSAIGDRVTESQFKAAIYDGFNSRISSSKSGDYIDLSKLPKKPSANYKSINEVSVITSADFNKELQKVVSELDVKGNYKGLIPIYQIRRAIGNKVTRADFDSFLKDLQGDQKVQMQGGGIEDDEKGKLEDSINTKTSGLRSYLRLTPIK